MWTGEFDSNTLRVDGESFKSGKRKISGYVGTGPKRLLSKSEINTIKEKCMYPKATRINSSFLARVPKQNEA